MKTGCYIAFAGIDGSGKTTQAALVSDLLAHRGVSNTLREGKEDFVISASTALAERYGCTSGRDYLGEEGYLFCLSFDVLREVTKNMSLAQQGAVVIASRSPFCRIAGAMRRQVPNVGKAEQIMLCRGTPDLLIWLDTDPEIARQRIEQRSFEAPPIDILVRYRDAFSRLLSNYDHVTIQDHGTEPAILTQRIASLIMKKLADSASMGRD